MARVRKIMMSDVPTLKKEAKVEEAARLLSTQINGCIVIVEDKKPIGMVTDLDIVRNVISKGKSFREQVSRMMTFPVTTMTPNMKLDEALRIIDTKRFRHYPVVLDGKLVGLVTKKDIVNEVSDNIKLHRNIQNMVLVLFVLFEIFVFVFSKYFPGLLSLG